MPSDGPAPPIGHRAGTQATGPTVTTGRRNGWDALVLANDLIEVVVLPDKGADIYSIVDVGSAVDVLSKTPWELRPPGSAPREGSDGAAFLSNYEGAWQELLPNTNDACVVDGVQHTFHGEVAVRPWAATVSTSPREASVHLSVDCSVLPLTLERTMRCLAGEARLYLDERVTNRGAVPVRFVWGHHVVLGPPLVGAGARLSVPCRTLLTPDVPWEDTARLEPGQRSEWPLARLRDGSRTDLSMVAGPELGSHDDVYLTDLDDGWARVWNPELGLGLELTFDRTVFRWLISWQPYGGAHSPPLAGSYGLGIEPWVSGGNLEHAVRLGEALTLPPGGTLSTRVVATLLHEDSERPEPDGSTRLERT
jgi:Domain of unknown function (DUF4432)